MAVFTSNQVNHVYVAKAVCDSVAGLTNPGDIFVGKTGTNELYFVYKNADGGIVRSDLIPLKNVMWANVIKGTDSSQKRALKKFEIGIHSLVDSDVDKTALTVVLEKTLHNGIETVYRKTATVLVKTTTIADVVDALKNAIDNSFSRDDYVKDDFTITTTGSGTSKKVVITEKSQSSKYKKGTYANEAVNFNVFTYDVEKMTVTGPTDTTDYIYNSYDIADLEYFALGERGDLYRNVGWPNSFPSKTLAEVGDSVSYGALRIHFAFTDSNEGVQKSEKDITIVFKEDASTPAVAGTALAANAAGTEGISYYTRANSSAGAGYLNDGSKAYTIAASIPGTHDAGVYYPLTDIGGVGSDMNKLLNKIKVAVDGGYSGKELLGNSATKLDITDYFN